MDIFLKKTVVVFEERSYNYQQKEILKNLMAKKAKRFSIINEMTDSLTKTVVVTRKGEVKIKRSELKKVLEDTFLKGAKLAASGERVKFPIIGTMRRGEVKARKAGKGKNPFTGQEIMLKARPASKKPRWSFPKTTKEIFANKKFW